MITKGEYLHHKYFEKLKREHGFPIELNKYLTRFLNKQFEDHGKDETYKVIFNETLPIFCLKVLFGRMSSSHVLDLVVKRYGFKEVESDLKWLKKLDKLKNKK